MEGNRMKDFSLEFNNAIRNGKWLDVVYDNGENITRFYAAIINFSIEDRTLLVHMFNLSKSDEILKYNHVTKEEGIKIFIDKILSLNVLEHVIYKPDLFLIDKLDKISFESNWMNSSIGEKRIFNYYLECLRYDVSPIISKTFSLNKIDKNIFKRNLVFEPEKHEFEQIRASVTNFDKKLDIYNESNLSYAFNLLSINTPNGLFPIIYKDFYIDLNNRTISIGKSIKVNRSIQIGDNVYHISTYLEIEEAALIELYTKNLNKLKSILNSNKRIRKEVVDTTPVLYTLKRSQIVNIDDELEYIRDLENKHHPLNAFLGKLTSKNKGRKKYPIFLRDSNVNIDQLRVINSSLRNPVTYVQGPPGTGKTTTILNVLLSYFVNQKTALLTSYNNKPIDDVFIKLKELNYHDKPIPFPVLRLGNKTKVLEALQYIKDVYKQVKNYSIYEGTLEKLKVQQEQNLQEFYKVLDDYETVVELLEKEESINQFKNKLTESKTQSFRLQINIEADLEKISTDLENIGTIHDEKALDYLNQDFEEFSKWLYYKSCSYFQKLGDKEYLELFDIIHREFESEDDRVNMFNQYLSNDKNLRKLLEIFPVLISTNLSVPRLGSPNVHFDISIIDEAGQCNIPSSLLPIARGEKLLLVGDVQQLRPVISLEDPINKVLKDLFKIREDYDYAQNSILSTMRAMDNVSQNVMLRYHYRCHPKIIQYSNLSYYEKKLKVKTNTHKDDCLFFYDIPSSISQPQKNAAVEEIDQIMRILKENPDKEFGVITPFRTQSELITQRLKSKFPNVEVGTIHKFQGGEKEGIIISSGVTAATHQKTYDWLKGNHPLINVAVTRAKQEIHILGDKKVIKKLSDKSDNFYQLLQYVESNGKTEYLKTNIDDSNIKELDSYFEKLFLDTVEIVVTHYNQLHVRNKVRVASVLKSAKVDDFTFFTRAEFDFVIYSNDRPIAVYEIDGDEHETDDRTKERDNKKKEICDKDNIILFNFF